MAAGLVSTVDWMMYPVAAGAAAPEETRPYIHVLREFVAIFDMDEIRAVDHARREALDEEDLLWLLLRGGRR